MFRGLSALLGLNTAPAPAPAALDSVGGADGSSTQRRVRHATAAAPLRRSPRKLGNPTAGGDTGLNHVHYILFYYNLF